MDRTSSANGRLRKLALPLAPAILALTLALALSACGSAEQAGRPDDATGAGASTGANSGAHLSANARPLSYASATSLSLSPSRRPTTRATCSLSVKPAKADFGTVEIITATASVMPPMLPPPGYPSLINSPKVFTLEGYYLGPVPVPAPIPGAPDIWRESVTNGLTARFAWPPTEPGVFLIVVKVQVRNKNGELVTICTAKQKIDLTRGPKVNASTSPATPPLTTATAQPTSRAQLSPTTPAPQPAATTPAPGSPTPRPTVTASAIP